MDARLWADMFSLGIPVLEKIFRPVVVYAFLIVGLRLAGKRELAQLNPFDLIVLLTLSNTVQNAIIGEDNSVTGGLIGASTLLAINYLVVRFLYGHARLEQLVEGSADVLIEDGRLMPERLKANLLTRPELEAAAHRQGFASLDEVERAVIEPTGTFSFFAKKPPPEVARHRELVSRLDEVSRELAALRAALSRPPAAG
jgi:uncharacterized membrane protein YcaP (DUF421 family)